MSQPVAQGFRLSPQQRRLWSLQKEAEGFPYRARAVARIEGRLDRAALAAALEDVAARHEILRTTFPKLPGLSLPAQAIRETGALRLEEEDLSSRAPEERDALLDLLWEELGERPFQPDREPPVVLTLVSLTPEDHRLFIAAHALAADAAALEVLVRDLARAYGREETEEPAQYADVAEALNELLESEETEAGREFWREAGPLTVGRLPLERQTEEAGFTPQAVAMDADPAILAAAQELAERRSVPLAAVPLAAWHAVLRRFAAEEVSPRSVVAVELAGRHYEGFESALGLFARSLPLAVAVEYDLPFADLVSRAGERLEAAGDWQDYFSWEALPIGYV
ncbi:MAG TPA: condensation domain-containing protein, partial [Thermoanaerobaculia bacterium]|nr:condensation domain-containing protein [Thermoanaerobaculia bacterium]